jgi:hypothetical protein
MKSFFPILGDIAERVFSLPASAAQAERNWSNYGFIQSALRNRLKDVVAMKLVYVFTNGKALKLGIEEEEEFQNDDENE